MSDFKTIPAAAAELGCHPHTVENWLEARFIHGFRDGKKILVDLNEIKATFKTNSHMRDPRKKKFANAKIVPLPIRAEVVPEVEQ